MSDTENDPVLPPSLRFLKSLVTVMMVVMILGVITIVGLLVTRLPQPTPQFELPEVLALLMGVTPLAITQGPDFWAVVSEDRRIFIFDGEGTLQREIAVDP